eukprot:6178581-Pleurochrysis_carterae.AAC.1
MVWSGLLLCFKPNAEEATATGERKFAVRAAVHEEWAVTAGVMISAAASRLPRSNRSSGGIVISDIVDFTRAARGAVITADAVSYTHLTLPTILLV